MPGIRSHVGTLEQGALSVGDPVHAAIDVKRRERIRRNHTATHILHWALRKVLGEHVRQAGSFVAPDRFRFDFTHFEAPSDEALRSIEELANHKVMENHPVRNYETSLATARELGVTALFGEKYGEIVRVLEVGNFSKELCGGTHVARASEIGLIKTVSESSVGANLRRIEAVTSFDALEHVGRIEQLVLDTPDMLECVETGDGFNPPQIGADAALGHGLDEPDLAGARDMSPAAELLAEVADFQHSDDLAVLLTEQGGDAELPSGSQRGFVVPDGVVLHHLVVRQLLDAAQRLVARRLEVREVEAEPVRRHEGACLPHVLAEYLAQRPVQDVGSRVVAPDALAPLDVDGGMHRVPHLSLIHISEPTRLGMI